MKLALRLEFGQNNILVLRSEKADTPFFVTPFLLLHRYYYHFHVFYIHGLKQKEAMPVNLYLWPKNSLQKHLHFDVVYRFQIQTAQVTGQWQHVFSFLQSKITRFRQAIRFEIIKQPKWCQKAALNYEDHSPLLWRHRK